MSTLVRKECSDKSSLFSFGFELHILHLPEEIVRHIFVFLEHKDLYFNVRRVCRQLRRNVEDYIQVGLKVFVTAGVEYHRGIVTTKDWNTSEIHWVFKQNGNLISSISKLASGFPEICGTEVHATFGGMYNDKMLVFHNESYHYKIENDDWIHTCMIPVNGRNGARSCLIGELILICGGALGKDVELLNPNSSQCTFKSQCTKDGDFVQTVCPTPLPVSVYVHTLTKVGSKKVILVGGSENQTHSNRVFQGELLPSNEDVGWQKLESMNKKRACHMTFKMKQSVYVAGGFNAYGNVRQNLSCCERYDLEKNTWFKCQHSLPFPLMSASVVVSADEAFALIVGGYKYKDGKTQRSEMSNEILVFTKDTGFYKLENSLLRCPRANPLAIRMQ